MRRSLHFFLFDCTLSSPIRLQLDCSHPSCFLQTAAAYSSITVGEARHTVVEWTVDLEPSARKSAAHYQRQETNASLVSGVNRFTVLCCLASIVILRSNEQLWIIQTARSVEYPPAIGNTAKHIVYTCIMCSHSTAKAKDQVRRDEIPQLLTCSIINVDTVYVRLL